jgi:hypothetical protein
VFDIAWQFSGTEKLVSSSELLSMYGEIDDINTTPGSAWIYNNGGYLLLSTAIERIAGRSLEEVLRERIFEPLGMYATLLHRWDGNFVPNSATAHMTKPGGGFEKSYFFGTAFAGEGGIVSTVDDMLRWLAHMDRPVVGSETAWRTLKTPLTLANGTATGYGLGLYVGQYRGVATLSHSGGGLGANAQMLKVPSAGLDVIVMVNRGDVWATALVDQILDACLPNLGPVGPKSSHPPATGLFRSSRTGRVIQLLEENGQQIASINGADLPVECDVEDVLKPTGMSRNSQRALTLVGDPRRPQSIRYNDYGNIDDLAREVSVPTADVSAIAGRYGSDTTGTEALIVATDEGPRLKTTGRFGSVVFQLERLAQDLWRARSMTYRYFGGVLSFEAGRFYFSAERTRALAFNRRAGASA